MADYAISNVVRRVVYTNTGVGPYAFTFEVLANTDIAVYRGSTLLTLTTDYTVIINANGTGSVTLVVAGTGNITIVGARAIQRTSDYTTGGDLFASTLNTDLDSQTIYAQQVAETAERGLKAPVIDPTDINMTLPAKATRAGTVLAFNATTGNPEAGPSIGSVTTVAAQSANINTVATNIASVNTVAGNNTNINTVAGISGNVTTVAGVSANVTTVAGISANVTTVAGNNANVSTVAGISGNVTTVAGISANVTTVAGINADVSTVATNNANVTTVATNIASVNTNATNIVAIQNASTNATNAATSATNAANSATAAAASAASAAASFDAFDDIYLGAKSSNPTVDNDGDPLSTGDQYFNTVSNELRVWNGSSWQAASVIGGTVNSLDVTGVASFSDGTVSLPSITNIGDTNTGIFFPAADTIAFTEGGVESMRINSSGVLVTINDASISGLTVGKGLGSVSSNTVVGNVALASNTTGSKNTAFGFGILNLNTTGVSNTGIGWAPLNTNTGSYNTAVGDSALQNNTTASYNTAVGYVSLYTNTTGSQITSVGAYALNKNTTGANNTAMGVNASVENTTGSNNTAIGHSALNFNTTASNNTAVGFGGLQYNITGTGNAALGYRAGWGITSNYNTAIGMDSMSNASGGVGLQSGANNTAVGYQTFYNLTSGANNTAVGFQALEDNTTGTNNCAMGRFALRNCTTGTENTAIGTDAGDAITTGTDNTLVGYGAAYLMTTGSKNTVLGAYSGNQGSLDIRTASNYIVLSDGDGNPRAYWRNDGKQFTTASVTDNYALGAINTTATRPYGVNIVFTGSTPNNTTQTFLDCEDTTNIKATIYSSGAYGSRPNSYGGLSDIKLKQDIVDASSQWDDIKAIRVRKFRFKDDPNAVLQIGVVAQEIEQTSAGLVYETPDYEKGENGEKVETGEVTKAVKYSILYMKAIKALQEAMERIETLEAKVQQLENK
jgi:hypothetical protein